MFIVILKLKTQVTSQDLEQVNFGCAHKRVEDSLAVINVIQQDISRLRYIDELNEQEVVMQCELQKSLHL